MSKIFPDDRVIYKGRAHGVAKVDKGRKKLLVYDLTDYMTYRYDSDYDDVPLRLEEVNVEDVIDGRWSKRKG